MAVISVWYLDSWFSTMWANVSEWEIAEVNILNWKVCLWLYSMHNFYNLAIQMFSEIRLVPKYICLGTFLTYLQTDIGMPSA